MMPKISLICILVFGAVLFALGPGHAASPSAESEAAAPSGPPKGYACDAAALTGSGPGFKSSQEESEEAAIADWLGKATKVFPDADWNTAKDPIMECVKQGLYSKCFATGFPCHPRSKE